MAHALIRNGAVVATAMWMPTDIPGFVYLPDDDARVTAFLNPVDTAPQAAMKQLQANDAMMFRALELLIDVLLAKNVILPTDFPPAVRTMYLARKALRVTAGVP